MQIHHDGNNSWLNPVVLKSICPIDVSFFPFDDQQCSLKFGSWAFDASGIDMKTPQPSGAPNSYYIPNGEWQLLSIESTRNEKKYQCCEVPFTDLTVKIKLRRHAINYTLTLIIPCALLSSLVFLGFVLPPESGERIGLSITVLLSVTVFQQLTSQIMPSHDFPYLAQYYLATILETGFSLVITTLILNLYHRSSRQMPWLVKKVVLHWLAPMLFCRKNKKYDDDEDDENEDRTNANDTQDVPQVKVDWQSNPLYVGCDHFLPSIMADSNGNASVVNGKVPKDNNRRGSKCRSSLRSSFRRGSEGEKDTISALGHSLNNAAFPLLSEDAAKQGRKVYEAVKKREREKKQRERDWLKAARVLDRLFLILFIIASLSTLVIIFFRAPRFSITKSDQHAG